MIPFLERDRSARFELFCGDNQRRYQASSSLHDFTAATGGKENRLGFVADGDVTDSFYIADAEPLDGCIKLAGMWLTHGNTISSLDVFVNGLRIWSGELHMPVVAAGWQPSVYWTVPPGCLRKGYNEFRIVAANAPLILNQVYVFVRSQRAEIAEPLFVPRVLKTDSRFCVTLLFYRPATDVRVEFDNSVGLIEKPSVYIPGENDFFFHAVRPSSSTQIVFTIDHQEIRVDLPPILNVPAGQTCLVGVDSDDHRHDDTGGMAELLKGFFRAEIGNLFMFRPKNGRNCMSPAPVERWRSWIDICRHFNGKYFLCDWVPESSVPPEIYKEAAADSNFVGCHMHEPYFLMQNLYSNEDFRTATNFESSKEAYVDLLRKYADGYHGRGIRAACGEAAWLVGYDVDAGFDIINIEIVTGASPHMGLARGALRGKKGKEWGHHIPIEWYLGYPNDEAKSQRFWLMMLLSYTHGARYIYAENSIFFTNSYERHDIEDDFTSRNRDLMSQFYDITKAQPRLGEACPELAVAYGNLESLFWYHDDVIPEMDDCGDWGGLLWNKWREAPHKACWRALDAWLPPVNIEKYSWNRSILKWFAGNPYGNVDVVPIQQSVDVLSRYSVLAFLGWNTMTDEILGKLKQYVHSGGTVFISACHFNRGNMLGAECISVAGAEEMLGLTVSGPGELVHDISWEGKRFQISNDLRLCSLDISRAQTVIRDDAGNPVLLRNFFGEGEVYFYNFWDYPSGNEVMSVSKAVMDMLGKKARSEFGIENGYGINCSHWYTEDQDIHRLYLVNVNWMRPRVSELCSVRLWNESFLVRVELSNPLVISVKGDIAVIPDSPLIYVNEIQIEDGKCRITLAGSGSHTIRVIARNPELSVRPENMDAPGTRKRECSIAVTLNGRLDLTFVLDDHLGNKPDTKLSPSSLAEHR